MAGCKARAVVLAAGKSTRFKTKKSKLLFNICGRTMILYPLTVLNKLNVPMTLVLGHQSDAVWQEVQRGKIDNASFVIQHEQKGTGHAVATAKQTWADAENVMILYGDMPLLTEKLVQQLFTEHEQKNATLSFFTTMVLDPRGYGRVIENEGKFRIVEEKDCTPEERLVQCINAGVYLINRAWLDENIEKIGKSPVTGEIYLVDLVKMACDQGKGVNVIPVPYDNVRGVNTLQELWEVEQIKRSEFIRYWMSEGVRFELAQSIHIDIDVKIGAGSFIGTGVHLLGSTTLGEECFVGAFSIIENTAIGDSCNIHSHSVIQDSSIGNNVHVGPFARLRKNVSVGNNVEIGNFVEIKRTTIGDDSRTKHLTYLGNTTIGKAVNVGAGTITCNFDGTAWNDTIIEDEVFIGSNNTLIAPVHIGKGAYTAGGSTINHDVPANSLALGRAKQENKLEYAHKLRETKREKEKQAAQSARTGEEESADVKEEGSFNFHGAVKTKNDPQECS